MRVRAAVLNQIRTPFEIEELDLAEPKPGEVLVRVRAVGVCHSDWHLVTGDTPHPMPLVAGHEGAGIVEAVGPGVSKVVLGDRVMLSWAPNCGRCFYCERGRPGLCEVNHDPIWAGTLLDGTARLSRADRPVHHYCALAAFADHTVVAESACIPMPDGLPYEIGAVIGCAVATGVGAVLNTAKVLPGSSVAVFGLGGVGLSCVMGAVAAGASRIFAVDTEPAKLVTAIDLGATDGVPAGDSAVDLIRSATHGRGADYVFEAVGIPSIQGQCIEAARPGGTVVFSGLTPVGVDTKISASALTRQEKSILGSYYGSCDPSVDFPRFAQMFLAGRLPLDRLVRRTYALEQINEAYADLTRGEPGRGVIVFER